MRQVLILGVTLIAIVLLWNTWVVYPLKILVVFFHELSHGMAAMATGGSVEAIQLSPAQGGVCITRGGSRLLTLTAGYLGSLLWGGAILLLAGKTRSAKWTIAALGALVLVVAIVFVRPLIGFGTLFSGATGLALFAAGRYLPAHVDAVILRVIGLTSCIYVILDIKSDTIDRAHIESDARMMAELTGVPTVLWGILWLLVALAVVYAVFRLAIRQAPSKG